jgi:hypothetical protein
MALKQGGHRLRLTAAKRAKKLLVNLLRAHYP